MTTAQFPTLAESGLSPEAAELVTGPDEHPIHPEHTPTGQLAFGVFFQGVNSSTIWRLPSSGDQVAWESFETLIRTAERGKFAAFFLGEGLRLREHRGAPELDVAGRPDAQTLLPPAAVTKDIGLVAPEHHPNDPVDRAAPADPDRFRGSCRLEHRHHRQRLDRENFAAAAVSTTPTATPTQRRSCRSPSSTGAVSRSRDGAHYWCARRAICPARTGSARAFQAGPPRRAGLRCPHGRRHFPHGSLAAAVSPSQHRRAHRRRGRDPGRSRSAGAEIVLAPTEAEAGRRSAGSATCRSAPSRPSPCSSSTGGGTSPSSIRRARCRTCPRRSWSPA